MSRFVAAASIVHLPDKQMPLENTDASFLGGHKRLDQKSPD
jgi:hypothetical protein